MMKDDVFVISVANFEESQVKIRFDQFLETLTTRYTNELTEIDLDISKILLEKANIEDSIDLDVSQSEKKNFINTQFKREATETNSVNSFILDISNDDENIKSDISDH